jgi:hypothetical protein
LVRNLSALRRGHPALLVVIIQHCGGVIPPCWFVIIQYCGGVIPPCWSQSKMNSRKYFRARDLFIEIGLAMRWGWAARRRPYNCRAVRGDWAG